MKSAVLFSYIDDKSVSPEQVIKQSADNKRKYELINPKNYEEEQIQIPKKSLAGVIWFENSLKKVIALYLIMNITILLFSGDFYIDKELGGEGNLEVLHGLYEANPPVSPVVLTALVNNIQVKQKKADTPILILNVTQNDETFSYINNQDRLNKLRNSELKYFYIGESKKDSSKVRITLVEDLYSQSKTQSLLQIFSLIFACLVLFFAYFSGSKDSAIYLTEPFKLIFFHLNRLIRQPLSPAHNPYYLLGSLQALHHFDRLDEEYGAIGKVFFKYCQFLAFAFGSRQCNFVADRLLVKRPANLLELPGEIYHAYIVVIQLADTMEAVSRKDRRLFYFIKKSHEIIQRTVDKFGGSTSCLLDGKFICVWRLCSTDKSNFSVGNRNSYENAAMCITCILKITAKLLRLRAFYGMDEPSNQSLSEDTSPGSSINCIVHCGQIYESLIGGEKKMDVLYMSPDISYISRLHGLSMLYNVSIMLTETVYGLIADSVKKNCRKIDIIKMQNSEKPMDLYSLDIAPEEVRLAEQDKAKDFFEGIIDSSEEEEHSGRAPERTRLVHYLKNFDIRVEPLFDFRVFHARIKEAILGRLIRGAKNSIFFEDPEIQSLLKKRHDFRQACRKAIDFYSLGAWDMARKELEQALMLEPYDGACLFLLEYIKGHDCERPPMWRGFRGLNF